VRARGSERKGALVFFCTQGETHKFPPPTTGAALSGPTRLLPLSPSLQKNQLGDIFLFYAFCWFAAWNAAMNSASASTPAIGMAL
jgi:hypothetical protein